MAYTESGEIATNKGYTLGDYSFRIERSSVPGSANDKVEAICTKGGKNARKSIQVPSTYQYNGYYVEANETTADVYAVVGVPTGGEGSQKESDLLDYPVVGGGAVTAYYMVGEDEHMLSVSASPADICTAIQPGGMYTAFQVIRASSTKFVESATGFTHNGKTVYLTSGGYSGRAYFGVNPLVPQGTNADRAKIAWTLIYGSSEPTEYEEKEMLIGRFAIDLEDAGGVGPGSDWADPGDYDEDWEEGDPTYTLHLDVIGALSGRHNDPIYNPSYSYLPADKATVKQYGSGGDGGHGGGGGAGAATVVVHRIATDKAENHEVNALAKRHGYGSGGGKGGKGGDGCILVYY